MLSRRLRLALPLALSVLLVDCTTKELAVTTQSPEHTPHAVVGEVVRLTLGYNRDAAMGIPIGAEGRWPLIVIGVGIVAMLLRMLVRVPLFATRQRLALGLVLGGAMGNLLSRVRSPRGVVDFIDLGVGSWRFYLFNVADVAIFLGAGILVLAVWRATRSVPPGDIAV